MIITPDDNDQLLKSINDKLSFMNDMLDKQNKDFASREKASIQLTNDLKKDKTAQRRAEREFLEGTKELFSGLRGIKQALIGAGGLGFVVNEIIEAGENSIKAYRRVAEAGQTFGGSLIQLGAAAASAGLPLDEFAETVAKNSTVIAKIGVGSFSSIAKQVRNLAGSAGLYGMTISDLNDFTGQYLETQRLSGQLNVKSDKQQAKSIKELVANVSVMSGITGKARSEIMSITQDALRQGNVTATMNVNAMRGMTAYNDAMQKAVMQLAAQPGEAGAMLANGLAETFASFGQGQFSELGKMFNELGLSTGTQLLNSAVDRISRGENQDVVTMELVQQTKNMFNNPQLIDSLRNLSLGGNQTAKTLLKMAGELQTYSLEDMKRQKAEKEQARLSTVLFSTLEDILNSLKGSFMKGILGAFGDIEKGIDQQKFLDSFKKFEKPMEELGAKIGGWVQSGGLEDLINAFFTITDVITDIIPPLMSLVGMIADAFKTFNNIVHMIPGLDNGFGTLISILAPFAAFKGVSALVKSFLGSKVAVQNVRAGVVNISGGSGGSGGVVDELLDNFGGDKEEGGTRGKGNKGGKFRGKGRMSRIGRVARAGKLGTVGKFLGRGIGLAEDVAASPIGKVAGGILNSPLAKIGGGALGLLGAGSMAFDLFKTGQAAANGEKVKERGLGDRALDTAQGAMTGAALGSIIPGIGTAVGAAVGGAVGLFGKDIAATIGDTFNKHKGDNLGLIGDLLSKTAMVGIPALGAAGLAKNFIPGFGGKNKNNSDARIDNSKRRNSTAIVGAGLAATAGMGAASLVSAPPAKAENLQSDAEKRQNEAKDARSNKNDVSQNSLLQQLVDSNRRLEEKMDRLTGVTISGMREEINVLRNLVRPSIK